MEEWEEEGKGEQEVRFLGARWGIASSDLTQTKQSDVEQEHLGELVKVEKAKCLTRRPAGMMAEGYLKNKRERRQKRVGPAFV